jgi:hypothetical protein
MAVSSPIITSRSLGGVMTKVRFGTSAEISFLPYRVPHSIATCSVPQIDGHTEHLQQLSGRRPTAR